MKKLFVRSAVLFLAALALFCLPGCGEDEEDAAQPYPTLVPRPPEDTVTAPSARAETAENGFAFIHNGVRIDVDAEAGAIVEALGEPLSSFEAPSCFFEGVDRTYTYGGFELDTYPTNGKDYVSAVVLTDDSVATPEGVLIGDSAEKLRQTYGEPDAESGSLLRYTAGNMELRFILDSGRVAAIEYVSLAVG